jgi:hypothetical protein
VPVWTEIEQSTSPQVRALNAWWTSRRADADMPDRSALWPGDILKLLPSVFLSELEPDPFRIRYRLVGTRAVALTGFDFTGRYLDEMQGEDAQVPWAEYYRTVVETRRPLLGAVIVPAKAGSTFKYEFGIFPMTCGGTEIRQFIAIEDYFDFKLSSAQWARGFGAR